MRHGSKILAAVAAIGWFVLAVSASAQTSGGSAAIAGTVKDSSGAVLPGVTVEASSPALIEKVRTAVSDEGGQYKIVNLPVGTYSVTFTLTGFNVVKREGVELTTNFTAPINVDLAVGSLQETVTVSGAAPVVDVQNTAVRNVISRQVLDSVPNGKTMLSLIAFTPGMGGNPSSQDVGGTKGDQMPFFAFHGSNSGDSKLQSNGFNVNIGGASGRVFVPSPVNTQEIAIELGGGNAEQPVSGIQFNYISKSGSNQFAVDILGSGTKGKLQSSNFNSDLNARCTAAGGCGLSDSNINHLDRIGDIGVGIGGPISADKLWFYTSYRYWTAGTFVAGQYFQDLNAMGGDPHRPFVPDLSRPVNNDYWGHNASVRLTWQASTRNKINFHYEWERRCDCEHLQGNNANFAGQSAGEATDYQIHYPADMFQTEWSFPATNKLLFTAGMQLSRPQFQTNYQIGLDTRTAAPGIGAVPIVDTITGQRWGGESGTAYSVPSRRNKFEPRFSATYVTGSHAFKGGFNLIHDWDQHGVTNIPGNMNWNYANGVPIQVVEFDTPYVVRENMKAELGVFAQDQWTIKHLTLNYGLRWDYVHLDVPAQTIDPSPFRPVTVNTDPVECTPCQSDWNPRVSASYDVFGNGKTALKVGVGRYSLARGNSVFNPANFIVHSATRTWTDANGNFFPDCNLQDNSQQDLRGSGGDFCGAQSSSAFGTVRITTQPDPSVLTDFRRYNWQTTAGAQQELMPGVSLSATYVRTAWSKFTITDHTAVTPADFDPYCIPVPSDSRLGLSGQNLCGFYAVNAAKFSALSTADVLYRADNFGTQTDVFNGVDITLNARLPKGAFVSGGTSTGREVFDNCYAKDRPDLVPLSYTNFSSAATTLPNTGVGASNTGLFCHVQPPFQTQFKLQGTYPVPWFGIQLSGAFQSVPGIPIFAQLQVPAASVIWPNGTRALPGGASSVTISNVIAPLTQFEDRVNQLDVRITKAFKVAHWRLQANVDVYNVLNGSGILSENVTYGPNWTKPGQILDARLVKFGAQINF